MCNDKNGLNIELYVRRYCQRMTNHQYRRNKKIQLRSLLTRDFSKDASICSQKHSTEASTAKTEDKKTPSILSPTKDYKFQHEFDNNYIKYVVPR